MVVFLNTVRVKERLESEEFEMEGENVVEPLISQEQGYPSSNIINNLYVAHFLARWGPRLLLFFSNLYAFLLISSRLCISLISTFLMGPGSWLICTKVEGKRYLFSRFVSSIRRLKPC